MAFNALTAKGIWNATTNNLALIPGRGENGDCYLVTTAGTTALGQVGDWVVGDLCYFAIDRWVRISGSAITLEIAQALIIAATPQKMSGPAMGEVETIFPGTQYDGFPRLIKQIGRKRIGILVNSTINHVGTDNLSKALFAYSDDDGKTLPNPVVLFGGPGLDCYTASIGIDHSGLISAYVRERNSGNKLHKSTRDMVNWSAINTISSVTGALPGFNIANFRFWGRFHPNPDAGVGTVGAGYWLNGLGAFQVYYVIMNAAGIAPRVVPIIDHTVVDSPNETAILAPTAKDRIAVTRRNGTASPAYSVSTDAGETWTYLGDMDIPKSGGWLPQEMGTRVINGVTYALLYMGHRRPGSTGPLGEPYPGPGAAVWYCPLDQALTGVTGWKMGHVHTWTHDPANTTDSYCSAIFDELSDVTIMASYNQLSETSAVTFLWRADNILVGPRTPDTPDLVQHHELGQAAYLGRRDIVGEGVTSLAVAYQLTVDDYGKSFLLTTTNPLTLPLAADVPTDWFVKVKARGATAVVAAGGSDTIDGGATLSLVTLTRGVEIRPLSATAWEGF